MSDREEAAPEAVFGLLSDATRVDILCEIALAQRDADVATSDVFGLSFSTLYQRVEVDNTSKLSYHLGELTGTLLRKGEHGYAFTHAGEHIARFVLSGNYGAPRGFESMSIEGTCIHCGDTDLEARLHRHHFQVECQGCERPVLAFPIMPAQAAHPSASDLAQSIAEKQAIDFEQIRRGICPECSGALDTTVVPMPDNGLDDMLGYLARDECAACYRRYNAPLPYRVVYHPASVAFHWDHGLDVAAHGVWEYHARVRDGRWRTDRIARNPDRFEVIFGMGDDELRIELDADATVRGTETVQRRGRD